ncbi:hypothetical protein BVRB_6g151170 [Beta vulgaris subsp. vulgaris]|nr:hypothetical protein BVRB_6g151170 [Beta vulgaris subsp. vulgaris]
MEAAFQSGFASALLDVLFSKVTDLFIIELKSIKNVDQAVQKLEATILMAQKLLREVDTSKFQRNVKLMHFLRDRVYTLTTLSNEAEDVMDEIALMITKRNSSSSKKMWRVRGVILRSLRTWTIPHGINKLQEKLDDILQQLKDLTTDASSQSNVNHEMPPLIEMHNNNVRQIPLVGRDNDVKAIIDDLITCRGSHSGVSIIGMVGLGKTVLAQTIMNDARVVKEFSVRLWVGMLNGQFNKEIKDKLAKHTPVSSQIIEKNLIIFDNLLEVTHGDWDDFWSTVKDDIDKGKTMLLITTRNPKISSMTSTEPYFLRSLSEDCCKGVIMKKGSSHNQNLSSQPRFPVVAGLLASKCEGLPLVARIIGLVLAKCDEDYWDTLLNEDLWEWPVFKEEIFPVLQSSYDNMEPDMKNCFAFLSLFPHNYHFNMDDLLQLWVGEGFIQQAKGSSSLVQIGRTHLDDLLGRSILQKVTQHMERPRFELHKFNQKFAQLAATGTYMRLDEIEGLSTLSSLNNNTRHLSLLCENIQPTVVWTKLKDFKRLCTVLSLYTQNKIGQLGRIPPNLFKKVEWLRVLALSNTDIAEVPDSLNRLKHLQYLDVSNTFIDSLPETLSEIHSLKILKFNNTPNFHRLPKDLQNLTNLLFVDWDISKIEHLGLPFNIGNLSSLHNLPLFTVGQKAGYTIIELQNLNNLQDSICIKNLENVKDGEEAKIAMLHKKLSLKRINLQWNTSRNDSIAKDVLEALQPPTSLKELKITRYGCDVFPRWITHPFPMLEKIHLLRCHSCTIFPTLGQLPTLKILILEDMRSLISVDTLEIFPSLEILEFKDMPRLREWKGLVVNAMLRLCKLKLINCPKLINFPSLENLASLVKLQIERCEALESLSVLPASLESLVIRDSPQLKDHCQVGGKEWLKIDAVPSVEINYKKIPTSGV